MSEASGEQIHVWDWWEGMTELWRGENETIIPLRKLYLCIKWKAEEAVGVGRWRRAFLGRLTLNVELRETVNEEMC